MIDELFPSLLSFFQRIVIYFDYLLIATDGAKYLVSSLVIVFFVALILIPLRGRGIDLSPFSDMAISSISKSKNKKHKKD